MENSLIEKTGTMKHLELEIKKVTIELETKSSHIEVLLQENREVCYHSWLAAIGRRV